MGGLQPGSSAGCAFQGAVYTEQPQAAVKDHVAGKAVWMESSGVGV